MWIEGLQTYNNLCWKAESNEVLKKILIEEMGISIRMISELKKRKAVKVNGGFAKNHDRVFVGDVVEVDLGTDRSEYEPEYKEPDILYEDHDVLVINKEPFIVVHPTGNHPDHTLLNHMEGYFRRMGIQERVRFINRLDRDTSGLLLIAKNKFSHFQMSKEHRFGAMEKTYLALVEGRLDRKQGVIQEKMGRRDENSIKREVFEGGQMAITHYRVLKEMQEASLVELRLETGRTHQIRCHMAYLGHPLLGDELYGGRTDKIRRQALHSYILRFKSPRVEGLIEQKAKLPQDMQELLDQL